MKYIVFEHKETRLKEPVIFADHTVHASVKVEGATAISAGHFMIADDGTVSTYGNAQSLGLKPKAGDADLLYYVLRNMGTIWFLDLESYE